MTNTRTRSVVVSRFRAGDSVADLADDYGYTVEQVKAAVAEPQAGDDRLDLISANRAECAQCAHYSAKNEGGDQPCCDCRRESLDKPSTHFQARAAEQAPEQTPAPRRRHRWEQTGSIRTAGLASYMVEHLRCRRCGLQARRVPTRTGGSLRMEVLGDEGSGWTPEISKCPGEREQEQRSLGKVDELERQVAKLEGQVERLNAEANGYAREVEIRGQLLDRVKVAMRATWWHGAVEQVEQIQSVAASPQEGSYRSLIAGWHRKAQSADHWRAKYERQIEHSKRVEAERNQLQRSLELREWPHVESLKARIGEATMDRDAARRERDQERATSARLRGLLRDMEYGHYPDGLASLCPVCHLTPRMGHSVDCRLAAALKEKDHG